MNKFDFEIGIDAHLQSNLNKSRNEGLAGLSRCECGYVGRDRERQDKEDGEQSSAWELQGRDAPCCWDTEQDREEADSGNQNRSIAYYGPKEIGSHVAPGPLVTATARSDCLPEDEYNWCKKDERTEPSEYPPAQEATADLLVSGANQGIRARFRGFLHPA